MRVLLAAVCVWIVASWSYEPGVVASTSCAALSAMSLADATMTKAESFGGGAFEVPSNRPNGERLEGLPAFCRVTATLRPSPDSDIRIEVWMPASGWNGKLQAVGNGGWAGSINYQALGEALGRGYASVSTDTGHVGGSGRFALGHPEKLIDFGNRSEHLMTVQAKAVISAFYGAPPRLSYWNGCSSGGRQGLNEAQRFPDDFDGIIAGDSANPSSMLDVWQVSIGYAAHKTSESFIPPAKYPVIHRAVLDTCDASDGLEDGLLSDPTRCHFDPGVLACRDGDGPSCLTAPQVETARAILSPLVDPQSGEELFPGLVPGAELGWGNLAGAEPNAGAVDTFKYVMFEDPDWNWRTFDVGRSLPLAKKAKAAVIDATDSDLTRFARRGGKLLLYHGWSDQRVGPAASINYYERVVGAVGRKGASARDADWIRLFMVPGLGHCRGGEGFNTFDMVGALDGWVERGTTPDRIVASRIVNGKTERSRPLCPYPQLAKYTKRGTPDEASSFVCEAP